MKSDRALDMLMEHQRLITQLLSQATDLLDGQPSALAEQLPHLRWQLLRALRAYQLFKHIEMFDPLAKDVGSPRADLAAQMKARCLAAGDDYTRHVHEWTLSKAHDDRAIYREKSRAMVGAIAAHLEREAREAGRLLSGVERTRRP